MVKASDLIKLFDFNLSAKRLNNAFDLLKEEQYSKLILTHYSDVLEVVMKYMTGQNYTAQPDVYETCESIVKYLSEKCFQEGILFEYLEIIETVKDDDVFTSILKGLQIIILNQTEKKSRALEYCLNSIEDYIEELPLSENLTKNIEDEEEKLLENNDQVRRILMMYVTLDLFYEPIAKQIVLSKSLTSEFRSNKFSRGNVLFCFILRLFGKPLCYLDLSHDSDTNNVKTYSRQCAENMIGCLSELHSDVYQLLEYVETRSRWPNKKLSSDDYEEELNNIFLSDVKTPLLQLGIVFYLIIAEDIVPKSLPKVYSPVYLFQSGIYLVNVMIASNESVVNKGLKLCHKLLANIDCKLGSDELDLSVHRDFCNNLTKLIVYSPSKRNRQKGLMVLKDYILKFVTHGRYLLLKNIFNNTKHKGLTGFLTTMYKDMIFEDLNNTEITQFSEFFSGPCFKKLLLDNMCFLTDGIKCDVMDSSDQIISSLNFLIAVLIRDKLNLTNVCDLIPDLQAGFLSNLRDGLDLSQAHYKNEMDRVHAGDVDKIESILKDTEILNGPDDVPELDSTQKIKMLHCALNTFDLMYYQLARVNEIINNIK